MFRERHEGEVLKMGEVFPRISANGELAQIFYTLIAKNLNQRLQRGQGGKGSIAAGTAGSREKVKSKGER